MWANSSFVKFFRYDLNSLFFSSLMLKVFILLIQNGTLTTNRPFNLVEYREYSVIDSSPFTHLMVWPQPPVAKLNLVAWTSLHVSSMPPWKMRSLRHLVYPPLGHQRPLFSRYVSRHMLHYLLVLTGVQVLAAKRRWQNLRKAAGKPYDKPNIVMNAAVQVCCMWPFTFIR